MAVVAAGTLWGAGLHIVVHMLMLGFGLVVRGWPWRAFLSKLPTFPYRSRLAHKGVGVGCEGLAMAGFPLQVPTFPHRMIVCVFPRSIHDGTGNGVFIREPFDRG